MATDDNHARLTGDGGTITTRLIAGDFPRYMGLVEPTDRYTDTVTVDTTDLADALDAAQVMDTKSDGRAVRLVGDTDTLEVTRTGVDIGDATTTIDATTTGQPIDIGLNPTFLADALDVCAPDGGQLDIRHNGALKPWRTTGAGVTVVAMPVGPKGVGS